MYIYTYLSVSCLLPCLGGYLGPQRRPMETHWRANPQWIQLKRQGAPMLPTGAPTGAAGPMGPMEPLGPQEPIGAPMAPIGAVRGHRRASEEASWL